MSPTAPAAGRRQPFAAGLKILALVAFSMVLGLPTAAAVEDAEPTPQTNVVFVGVAGLAWEDVTAEDMPTLHGLASSDAVAGLSVRTIRARTCAVDGWLTVGAGRRATDLIDSDEDDRADRYCRPAPVPIPNDTGGAIVPAWQSYVDEQANHAYNTTLGLLGERLAESEVCATAVGPGAALALADSSGRVASYSASPAEVDPDVLNECPVTVIDLGTMPPPAPADSDEEAARAAMEDRQQVARGIDELIGELIAELPEDTALLIAGVSDSGPTAIPLHNDPTRVADRALRVAVAHGPTADGGTYGADWLTSPSTRWSGIAQLTDVASTLLRYAGVDEPTKGSVGRPWEVDGAHPASAAETIDELSSTNRAAQLHRRQSGLFFQLLGIIQLIVFGAAVAAALWRPGRRRAMLRLAYVAAIAIASFPVASYLANLAPWARFDRPVLALWTIIVAIAAAVMTVAMWGPWRRYIYGPAGFIGGLTAAVMALDVSFGSQLQQLALPGISPLVAGRFYGFGNTPFAIFMIASLVASAALAQWMIDHGRSRRQAAVVTAIIGVLATITIGSPQAGADVGGILAAIPSFAVLVLGILRARLTVLKLALAAGVAIAIFLAIAWLDWLRPAGARTHFGEFFGDLVDGEAATVIWRKLAASLGTFGRFPQYAWMVPIAYAVILWLIRRPGIGVAADALRRWPIMTYLVWAGLVAGAIGCAVNDSGVTVPGHLLTVGVPMVVAAVVSAYRHPELNAGNTLSDDVAGTATTAAPRA